VVLAALQRLWMPGQSGRCIAGVAVEEKQFAEFYPDRAAQMFRVLINSLNGGESPLRYQELVAFLGAEGVRLSIRAAS
jgi:hypothetical protein